MNFSLAQIIVTARNNDLEGWMNILFVVILAVFWAVAGIVKAKTRKREPEDEEESARQPAHRPLASSLREQFLKQLYGPAGPAQRQPSGPSAQQPRKKVAAPQPGAPKYAAPAERTRPPATMEPLPELDLSLPQPQLQPEILEAPVLTGTLARDLEAKIPNVPEQVPQTEDLTELLSDYADPEELRRAILHYEILGQPLSLRDPSANIIGL